MPYPNISKSLDLLNRAETLIPSATQTIAKGPTQFVRGVAPVYLERGSGAKVWDVDGNEYIDLNMAVGPLSLGYCYNKIDEAVREQLEKGMTFSLMHPLEVEVAELISRVVPNAERIRYSKTGADVVSAAIRLARAHTGREKVLCCGYHGWHAWYAGTLPANAGVPDGVKRLTGVFAYNDIESLIEKLDESVAGVILEPAIFEDPKNDFLNQVRQACDEKGAVLIFDEMWTGFRLDLGGAQEYFGVDADLALFSKAIANGMPLSVISGKAEIMDLLENEVFFYTTFGGEALSLAAAKATIHEIEENDVCRLVSERGQRLKDELNELIASIEADYLACVGFPCRSLVTINHKEIDALLIKSLLQQEMIRCGMLWSGFHNLSFSHQDSEIDAILEAYKECLPITHKAVSKGAVEESLKGDPVLPVFRKTKY